MKYGDHILVRGIIKGATNEKEPSGYWWVSIEGNGGLTAVHESEIICDGLQGYSEKEPTADTV